MREPVHKVAVSLFGVVLLGGFFWFFFPDPFELAGKNRSSHI